jgi:hypothetical protein
MRVDKNRTERESGIRLEQDRTKERGMKFTGTGQNDGEGIGLARTRLNEGEGMDL